MSKYEFIDEFELEEMFSTYFDEKYGEIEFFDGCYMPTTLLKSADIGFFNDKMEEWIDENEKMLMKLNRDRKIENEGEE